MEIQQNVLVETLPYQYREWEIGFNIKPIDRPDDTANILKCGLGGDLENYGDRNPSVWMVKASVLNMIYSIKNFENFE